MSQEIPNRKSVKEQLEEYRLRKRMEAAEKLDIPCQEKEDEIQEETPLSKLEGGYSLKSTDHDLDMNLNTSIRSQDDTNFNAFRSQNDANFNAFRSQNRVRSDPSLVVRIFLGLASGFGWVFSRVGGRVADAVMPDHLKGATDEEAMDLVEEGSDELSDEVPDEEFVHRLRRWAAYFLVWCGGLYAFAGIGFGVTFFLVSMLVFIGLNLRSGPRRRGEISAYSVFNRDMRRIHGTVSAEQLQREMVFL